MPKNICYAYHHISGEFICPLEMDLSPLDEDEVYLQPAHTTLTPPPENVPEGEWACWRENKWVVLPDHRGEVWFDKEGGAVLIQKAGDPTTFDPPYTKEAPPPPPPGDIGVVTSVQALIQLSRMPHDGSVVPGTDNLLDATEALISQSTDRELKTWFNRSQTWKIDNPNVLKIGQLFHLTKADIQAAFNAAYLIEE